MEGPHIHHYAQLVSPLIGHRLIRLGGQRRAAVAAIRDRCLIDVRPIGKLLFLRFEQNIDLRIHCLMFGDVRINRTRPRKRLTLRMTFDAASRNTKVYVTLGSTRIESWSSVASEVAARDICLPGQPSRDTMDRVRKHRGDDAICDVLLDQTWFPGLGNKIKNEVLYRAGLHPLTQTGSIAAPQWDQLRVAIDEFAEYFLDEVRRKGDRVSLAFAVFRKSLCPGCGTRLIHEDTGVLSRKSHFCPRCQSGS